MSKGLLSNDTVVQGDYCPMGLLSKEVFTSEKLAQIIVQLGLDFKLNTKIGLDTTTHHPPPQTFRPLPGLLGG